MSNELNNIISMSADGVYEGVAIGGDRYPGSTFMDHVMRYEMNDDVKMIVLLGEVGGTEEYKIVQVRSDSILLEEINSLLQFIFCKFGFVFVYLRRRLKMEPSRSRWWRGVSGRAPPCSRQKFSSVMPARALTLSARQLLPRTQL